MLKFIMILYSIFIKAARRMSVLGRFSCFARVRYFPKPRLESPRRPRDARWKVYQRFDGRP